MLADFCFLRPYQRGQACRNPSRFEGVHRAEGDVHFTVPAASNADLGIAAMPDRRLSVWSFGCKAGLRDAIVELARVSWVRRKQGVSLGTSLLVFEVCRLSPQSLFRIDHSTE
jgi:preprotein translocase subunit SecE